MARFVGGVLDGRVQEAPPGKRYIVPVGVYLRERQTYVGGSTELHEGERRAVYRLEFVERCTNRAEHDFRDCTWEKQP